MKALITALVALTAISASASRTITLQGTEFQTDTLAHYYIGPGVTHTALRLHTGSRSVKAYVIALDRKAADRVRVKVDVGNDRCRDAERITSIAARKTTDTRQYLAGINGDFFITSSFAGQHEFGNAILGYPNMSCATDGKLVAPDMIDVGSRENALIVARDGYMYIDATDLRYRILNNDGSLVFDAVAVNYPRRDNELMVYNSYNGATTGTATDGREIILEPAEGMQWRMNKSMKFIVKSNNAATGDSPIPADGIVISLGRDYAGMGLDYLTALAPGDAVKLKLVCSLPAFDGLKPDISEICGGDVRILNKGVTTTEAIRWINTPTAQYGRSLVGYSEDRNTMVMCAVDAGVAGSSGVTYFEAADLMRALGCYDALDLDGGGSTAVWSHSHGILNTLRDGSERAVGNGIFLTLDAPEDSEIASIRFADFAPVLPRYAVYRPVIYGYNRYGQLIDTDVKGATLSASDDLGSVSADGAELLASGIGMHALTASFGSFTASIPVTVDATATASPRVTDVLLDHRTEWTVELQATVGNRLMSVAPRAYAWTSSDEGVATVDAEGKVKPVGDGTAVITGTLDASALTVNVTVQTPQRPLYVLDRPDADWKLTLTSTKNAVLTPKGDEGGFDLSFDVSRVRGPRIAFAKDIVCWSRPDNIRIVFNPLGSTFKTLGVKLHPANIERPVEYSVPLDAMRADADNVITIPVSEFTDTKAIDAYPLIFKGLSLIPEAKTGSYACRVVSIQTQYDNPASAIDNIAQRPQSARLHVVRQGEMLVIGHIAATLAVYTPDGRLVSSARNASAVAVPSTPGLYIVAADNAATTFLLR